MKRLIGFLIVVLCLWALFVLPAHANPCVSTFTGTCVNSPSDSTSNAQQGQQQQQQQAASVVNQTNQVRQAPSVIATALIVPQCANGVGAGGSAPGGSLFANVIWTPHDCKLLRAAGALQALGMYNDACVVVVHTKALQKMYAEFSLPLPVCVPAPVAVVEPLPVVVAPVEPQASPAPPVAKPRVVAKRVVKRAAGCVK